VNRCTITLAKYCSTALNIEAIQTNYNRAR
jgi:hypothetical protein